MNSLEPSHRLQLWQSSRPMAHAMVKDYVFNAMHKDDAIQEVMLGLWEATLTWQADLGASFDHYAHYIMRRNLFTYLTEKADDRPTLSRRELDLLKLLKKYLRQGQMISSALMVSLGEETGIDPFRLQQIVAYWYSSHCAITAHVYQESSEALTEFESSVMDEEAEMRLDAALQRLSERERLIIAARFLEDPRQKLSTLAKTLGISIERVRVIEGKSLQKLRSMLE